MAKRNRKLKKMSAIERNEMRWRMEEERRKERARAIKAAAANKKKKVRKKRKENAKKKGPLWKEFSGAPLKGVHCHAGIWMAR